MLSEGIKVLPAQKTITGVSMIAVDKLKTLQSERDSAYHVLKFNVEQMDQNSVEYFIELQQMYAEYLLANDNLEVLKNTHDLMGVHDYVPKTVGSSISDHMSMRYGQDIITSIVKSNVDSMSTLYSKAVDRLKYVSPSTEVIDMDCTGPKELTNYTVVVEGTVTRRIYVLARDQKDADNLALDEFNSLLGPDNACVVGYGE
jgi:hypothetical protein